MTTKNPTAAEQKTFFKTYTRRALGLGHADLIQQKAGRCAPAKLYCKTCGLELYLSWTDKEQAALLTETCEQAQADLKAKQKALAIRQEKKFAFEAELRYATARRAREHGKLVINAKDPNNVYLDEDYEATDWLDAQPKIQRAFVTVQVDVADLESDLTERFGFPVEVRIGEVLHSKS